MHAFATQHRWKHYSAKFSLSREIRMHISNFGKLGHEQSNYIRILYSKVVKRRDSIFTNTLIVLN